MGDRVNLRPGGATGGNGSGLRGKAAPASAAPAAPAPVRLAILGGEPAFSEPLHVGRPNIGDRNRFLARVNEMLDRRWLTNGGPFCIELEQRIAEFVGVKHCIAVCNATVALEIAVRAAGLSGEMIMPAFTFVATAHALQWQQITPVFCDMDPKTHQIDPAKIEALITPRTSGIIGVHVWGRACDVEALAEIARRRNLAILYDAAHAFGCSHGGRMIGGFGLAEVFSFHATKFFNTFEGGAVTTNDDDLADRIRLMRNFGFSGVDNVIHVGTNGKMSEVCAAMGLTGLEHLDEVVAVNRAHYHRYRDALRNAPGLSMVEYDEREACNYQYIVLEVDPAACPLTRDELLQVLLVENVLARRYFWPGVHRMEPYRSFFPHAHLLLPETERIAARIIVLPTGTATDAKTVDRIAGIILAGLAAPSEVRAALRSTGVPRRA